jgi:hypothetical protein
MNFRISSKRIFLTYPQFNSTKDDIKEQLFQILTNYIPFKYCISHELHKDGNSHFHVFLESSKKFSIRNANLVLKLKTADGTFKSGDYRPVKNNVSAVLRYLIKSDNNPLTNISFNFDTGKELSIEEKITTIYENEGYYAAINYTRHNLPKRDLLKKFKTIESQLKVLHKIDNQTKLNFLPLNLTEFIKHPAGKQIED